MKQVQFYNEKGNALVQVRADIKAKATAKLLDVLTAGFANAPVKGEDGAIYIPVFLTEKDETIYFRLEGTVSVKDPATKAEPKAKAKKDTSVVELPELV